jgi:hypothetical protein
MAGPPLGPFLPAVQHPGEDCLQPFGPVRSVMAPPHWAQKQILVSKGGPPTAR